MFFVTVSAAEVNHLNVNIPASIAAIAPMTEDTISATVRPAKVYATVIREISVDALKTQSRSMAVLSRATGWAVLWPCEATAL